MGYRLPLYPNRELFAATFHPSIAKNKLFEECFHREALFVYTYLDNTPNGGKHRNRMQLDEQLSQ